MVWVSGWRLVSAVGTAGGIGFIGSGSMRPDLLREHIRKAKSSGVPFGVNVPVFMKHTSEVIKTIIEENVEHVITSAGDPGRFSQLLRDGGVKTLGHVVANRKFAEKAQKSGVDYVIAEGVEAGGHNGREELTTMVLIPLIRSTVDCPVVAAGGISSGQAWAAAMALGADGVQIGSRFALTQESSAHDNFKEAICMSGDGDTWMALKKLAPVRLLRNPFAEQALALESGTAEAQAAFLGSGRARQGMFEGDMIEGELEIGQVACLLDDIPSVQEVVDRLVGEFNLSLNQLQKLL